MQPRLSFGKVAPAGFGLVHYPVGHVKSTGLERSLLELVKVYTSRKNGCAYRITIGFRNIPGIYQPPGYTNK